MESHLHTLHLVKSNNEHKIIKRRVKAICCSLYNSRLELQWKQICMNSLACFLKLYTGKNSSIGIAPEKEKLFCLSMICRSMFILYEGHHYCYFPWWWQFILVDICFPGIVWKSLPTLSLTQYYNRYYILQKRKLRVKV